jgi:hypothetical protein
MKKITITRSQFLDFIKKDSDTPQKLTKQTQYYLDYYDQFMKTGRKTSWNWSAALGGFFWGAYRRMYLYMFLLNFGLMLLLLPLHSYEILFDKSLNLTTKLLFSLCNFLIIGVIDGGVGNFFYIKFVQKKINKGIIKKPPSQKWMWFWLCLQWIPLIYLVIYILKVS